jgi:hypothetical protein
MAEVQQASSSDEQWTCGKGLAAHARIPAKIAEFLKGLAENLKAHVPTIDTSDPNGETEWAAYVRLSKEYDALAAQLARTAKQMHDYRDLPAARHHEEELADPRLVVAFKRFVALETELADLLATSAEQDRQLLQESQSTDE